MSSQPFPIAPSLPSDTCLATNPEPQLFAMPNSNVQSHPQQAPCVPQLVAAQAALSPDAPAVIADLKAMSYRELDERANQHAHYLIGLGVEPNDLVGLCLDRSVTAVVWALATLKTGAAYLPLDPSYPSERLAFTLSDAQPRVLITRQDVASQLPASPCQVIAIDRDDAEIVRLSTDSPACNITAEQLAYVIYTSGSTGQPKGVEIRRRRLMEIV